ncbi:MAG: hypothetical protein IJ881_03455 [Neisseriaceae bacterium]|nr:hypothetical protein [Neisseriaceae bacterium]
MRSGFYVLPYGKTDCFLDNASIIFSGCLKRSSTNEVKLKHKHTRTCLILQAEE